MANRKKKARRATERERAFSRPASRGKSQSATSRSTSRRMGGAKQKKGENSDETRSALAAIPSMTALLHVAAERSPFAGQPRTLVTQALRAALADLRRRAAAGDAETRDFEMSAVLRHAEESLRARRARRLVRVINATGVVLHTGLGRSVLPTEAVERLAAIAGGYCNLEIDLDSGERGLRGGYAESLLCELTGAEAAMIVNNNAAATLLVLSTLARDREVIVSRGQLIEIGGSYRLPDVMAAGGAILKEVGATNKTHLRDYQRAINESTGLILHVHTSNYRIVGFVHSPEPATLAKLAHDHELPFFDDLGSGALLDEPLWRDAREPTVVQALRNGADIVAFSGDKLLGGPQAGILIGHRAILDRLRSSPMARALRVGKLTLAALEAVLELYQDHDRAKQRIPLLARLCQSAPALMKRADALASVLRRSQPQESFSIKPDESFAGGGSLPAWPLPTATVRWRPSRESATTVARALRIGEPSVLARINEGAMVFDVRTIADEEFDGIATAVAMSMT